MCPKCQNVRAKCADCPSRSFAPLSDRELIDHFKGRDSSFRDVIGLYVLDSECKTSVLVADFDKAGWREGPSPPIVMQRSGWGSQLPWRGLARAMEAMSGFSSMSL